MHKVLKDILEKTKRQVKARKQETSIEKLNRKIVLQKSSLSHKFLTKIYAIGLKKTGVIAEIKLASPNAGILGSEKDLTKKLKEYKKASVDALSVVTEKTFFKGDLSLITKIKSTIDLPLLHKDFVVDPYQVYESKALGADALLLIARILEKDQLKEFVDICLEVGLDPVVEINSIEDAEKALDSNTQIIAVNARDLDTFDMDVAYACALMKKIPLTYVKLGFSGVDSKKQVRMYRHAGASAVLIGTKLMQTDGVKGFLKEVLSGD
ncbi:indole-3-glycerol-phosphate synthase [Candidatus Daviesbacteria bacterium]|nr:indole-3-glycerol-phosphate synthase [Candidatus Daviesbacteria bacterium]